MLKRVLGVSWLGGTLVVAIRQGSSLKAAWTCPRPVEHLGELIGRLKEGMQETGFKGGGVLFVLDHRQLVYHLQETPPGSAKLLRPFLQRKASQNALFDGEPVWGAHCPVTAKGTQRILLTLLPRSVLSELEGVCAELGLTLEGVFSPSAVLSLQLRQLNLPAHETVLLVADLGPGLCLVAGRGDGKVLFCRMVRRSGAHQPDRAGQEINRTLLYVQQQFGVAIHTLWVFGDSAFAELSRLNIREGLQVRKSPVDEEAHYFALAAAGLASAPGLNLVPVADRWRRKRRRWMMAGAAALFIGAVTTSAVTSKLVRAREAQTNLLTRHWNLLDEYRDQLLFRQQEIILLENRLATIGSPEDPARAPLFLRYLSEAVPDAAHLTGVSLQRSGPGYDVKLEGMATDGETPFLPLLEQFETTLTNGMFRLQIKDSTRRRILGFGTDQPVRLVEAPGRASGSRSFFIFCHIE